MRVLFTGGTGQISLECVRECVRAGHAVSVFNRGLHVAELPESVEIITGDFNDSDSYSILAERDFDILCQFRVYETRDIERDMELFKGKLKQYIFISSASAYIKPPTQLIANEETALENKYWSYSQNKADCEAVLRNQDILPYTIVRPSHTVSSSLPTALGEKDIALYRIQNGKPVIVPGDGSSLWTLTHASDFAKPFVKLLGNDKTLGEAYNLTSSNAYRWDEIYQAIGRALGVEHVKIVHVPTDTLVRYNPDWVGGLLGDKSWTSIFDNSKIKSVVGDFDCNIKLDEMMQLVLKELGPAAMTDNDEEMNALMDSIIADQEALG